MFTKFIRHDLSYGILFHRKNFFVAFLIFFLLAGSHFLILRIYEIAQPVFLENPSTTGDYFLSIIGGYGKVVFLEGGGSTFEIPAIWMFFVLWMQFTSLYYPFIDLDGIGKQLMVISGKRGIWWLSKCIWAAVNTVLNYMLIFLASTFSGLCFGAKLSMNANYYLAKELDMNMDSIRTDTVWNLWPIFLCTGLALITLSLFQLMLSIIVKPLFSYLFIAGFLLAGAYMQSPLLFGNYLMAARSSLLITSGLEPGIGCFICLWVILISLIIGYTVFEHKDILGKD
jgi:hypothetical protein